MSALQRLQDQILIRNEYKSPESESKVDGEPPECAICYTPFQNRDDMLVHKTQHLFHTACLTQWVTEKNNCPVCRHEFMDPARFELIKNVLEGDILMVPFLLQDVPLAGDEMLSLLEVSLEENRSDLTDVLLDRIIIDKLLNKIDVSKFQSILNSGLIRGAENGFFDLVEVLLAKGKFLLKVRNEAMQKAEANHHVRIVQKLDSLAMKSRCKCIATIAASFLSFMGTLGIAMYLEGH